MTIFDIIIIVIILLGLIIGWNRGMIKIGVDLLILFFSMLLSSILKNVVFNLTYLYIPVIKIKGLSSLYLILYQLIIYVFLLLLFIGIFNLILRKLKLDDKLLTESISSSPASRVIGAIIGMPFMIFILYNLILILNFPIINIDFIKDSSLSNNFMERTLLLKNTNISLYYTEYDTYYTLLDLTDDNKDSIDR